MVADFPRELEFNVIDKFAIRPGFVVGDVNVKAVERIAVMGGMDLRIENVVTNALEKAANTRKLVGFIAGVTQHLQAFALFRKARAHHGFGGMDARMQHRGGPGNAAGIVAQEINRIKLTPERLMGFGA